MGERVKGIGHPDLVVGAHAHLFGHHEGGDAGLVGLPGKRHELKHHFQLFAEILRRAERRIRKMYLRAAGLLQLLDPALDLADRVEVVGQGCPVARPQSIAHAACLRHHVIEDAAGLLRNLGALGVRIALAEQLTEHLSRVVLHRQWLCWCTERRLCWQTHSRRPARMRTPPALSPASSIDGSGVLCPMARAASWSAVIARSPLPSRSFGPTQESQVPAMMPWGSELSPPLLRRPVTTVV